MSAEQEPIAYNMQPFRRAVFRGLGLVLPPLLTIVILLWIGSSVQKFVLNPVEWSSRRATVWFMNKTLAEVPEGVTPINPAQEEAVEEEATPEVADTTPSSTNPDTQKLLEAIQQLERKINASTSPEDSIATTRMNEPRFELDGEIYVQLDNGEWIPEVVRESVNEHVRSSGIPLAISSGKGYYNHYVEYLILKKSLVIPVFLAGFILMMYLLGKFLAAGVGRILWNSMEVVINQLPIIRTVYNSVKQVTDFFVGESDIDFQRVVAVQYPSKGIWSIGFVTGESLLTIRGAADEPVVSVLMPTSPVPGTGFTISVRKSETVDIDIPIEQALQFVVSCGVVIPDNETGEHINRQIEKALGDEPVAMNS